MFIYSRMLQQRVSLENASIGSKWNPFRKSVPCSYLKNFKETFFLIEEVPLKETVHFTLQRTL